MLMRPLNSAALNMIKSFEGLRLTSYQDIVGVWTIGWGCTGPNVGPNMTITEDEAEQMLAGALASHQTAVESYLIVDVNDNQFGALVSFDYNLGDSSLHTSTLLKLLNEGNSTAAAEEFLKWDHAGGQIIPGLLRRRQAERALFLQPVSNGVLPDGPSDDDIENKLKDIENDV